MVGVTNHWTTNHSTGLDWTGILKFVFMLRGVQLEGNHIRYDWLAHSLALHSLHA